MKTLTKFLKNILGIKENYGKALEAVKSKFKAMGEPIYSEHGMRVYKIKGSEDLLEISAKYDEKNKIGQLFVNILFPTKMSYKQYQSRVGKPAGIFIERGYLGNWYCERRGFNQVLAVSPQRYENRIGKGGISQEKIYNGQSYFAPSAGCDNRCLRKRSVIF